MKHKIDLKSDVIGLPDDINQLNMIADRLWFEFFTPLKPNKPETKKKILDLYNRTVAAANKITGQKLLISLTLSTHWRPGAEETGPEITNAVFTDVRAFDYKAPPASKSAPNLKKTTTASPKPPPPPTNGGSIIQEILKLHQAGKSNKEIIAMGFNKSTVGRQVGEFKKRQLTKS